MKKLPFAWSNAKKMVSHVILCLFIGPLCTVCVHRDTMTITNTTKLFIIQNNNNNNKCNKIRLKSVWTSCTALLCTSVSSVRCLWCFKIIICTLHFIFLFQFYFQLNSLFTQYHYHVCAVIHSSTTIYNRKK